MSKAWDLAPLTLMSDGRTKPAEYLDFARKDIIEGDTRSLVNALGNIKHAVDTQVEVLLEVYGLLRKSKKENWGFPSKLGTIGRLGIISPNILNKINTLRNEMEHEHVKPDKDEVTECLEIAEMFLEIFKRRNYGIRLIIDYDGDYAFIMDREKGEI
jgi:hypothetical protein